MDHEVVGRPAGRVGGGGVDRPGDGLADPSGNDLKPWLRRQWVIPAEPGGAFVAAIEDVVEVYHRPHDPGRPAVRVDEGGKQPVGDARPPLPVRPGSPTEEDSEYERHGTAILFRAFEPLAGRRVAEVPDHRAAADSAGFLRRLLDEVCPSARTVVLVTDTLNAHGPGSLDEAFVPAEAGRLAARIEWHYTPKHGSWLNVAGVELSVPARPCLDRRTPDRSPLAAEVATWEQTRSAPAVKAGWQSTPADARVKLKKLYPTSQVL